MATAFNQIRFDHDGTGYRLSGFHSDVNCLACHNVEDFSKVESSCATCHQDIHRTRLGVQCGRCHVVCEDTSHQAITHTVDGERRFEVLELVTVHGGAEN